MLNLVTGGAGFIGSHIAEKLLERGERVRILDNLSTGKRANLAALPGIEFFEGDVRRAGDCARACAGADYVFHQAALPSVPRSLADPLTTHEVCATGTLNVLRAAYEAKVRRVIYAGSSSAYGDTPVLPKTESMPASPRSPYAAAKLAGEHYCSAFFHSFGIETVTLRYFNVFGPRQDPTSPYTGVMAIFISRLLDGKPCTIYGDGETSRDFTFVANVAAANLLARDAATAPGNVYNVACGRRITLRELYREVTAALQSPLHPIYAEARVGDIRHSLADLAKIERDLGYRPEIGLAAGLHETITWCARNRAVGNE